MLSTLTVEPIFIYNVKIKLWDPLAVQIYMIELIFGVNTGNTFTALFDQYVCGDPLALQINMVELIFLNEFLYKLF